MQKVAPTRTTSRLLDDRRFVRTWTTEAASSAPPSSMASSGMSAGSGVTGGGCLRPIVR